MVVESVAALFVEQLPILFSVLPVVIEEHPCIRELSSQFGVPANEMMVISVNNNYAVEEYLLTL